MPNKYHPFDSRLEHRAAGAATLTADTTLDTIEQKVAMRTDYATIFNIESIDITSSDELYELIIEVSNDDFTTVEIAGYLSLGDTAVRLAGAPDNAAGDQYCLEWSTEVNKTVYKDWRIRLDVTGTTPIIGLGCHSSVR